MAETDGEVEGIALRRPTAGDGAALHALVRECEPLDENSIYCNLLQCSHFAGTGIVAEKEGRLVGFVTGYRLPERPQVYFLWQVGVAAAGRGHGLAMRMIRALLAREDFRGVRELQTTVTPSNGPSRKLFAALARAEGAELSEHEGFTAEHFGASDHEPETLFRIRPLRTPSA